MPYHVINWMSFFYRLLRHPQRECKYHAHSSPDLLFPHMDISNLDRAVLHYYSAALTPATKKTYKAAERHYLQFCRDYSLPALPTSENLLCYFVTCLGQQGLAHSTIRTYSSGVHQIQIALQFMSAYHPINPPET